MLADDRQERIVRMVREAGSITVTELASALDISESTIRRDLVALDASHRLSKVHGGATSLERAHTTRDLTISERRELHTREKEAIARYAASLIEPDSYVYIDSGSSTLRLVQALPHIANVVYVTNSVGHARLLRARGERTVVLGGELKEATDALVGPDALATLERYRFTCGFWGANGISAEAGLTTPDIEEAQVKRISMQHAQKRYVVSDTSKFDLVGPVVFAAFDDVTVLTAGAVPASYKAQKNVIAVDA